jgi:hypothetical protein
VAKLIGIGAPVATWCAAPGWMRWAYSSQDGLVHAFLIEGSQLGRWLRAVYSFTVPPAVLSPASVVGPRCVLALPAARGAPRCPDRPGMCARLLGCRHRHDQQPSLFAQVRVTTLPSTTTESAEHELGASSVAGPAYDTASGLVSPSAVRHNPRAAR